MTDVPAEIPVTIFEDPMVATELFPELHVPPDVASARVVVKPGQVTAVPVMAAGRAFIVMVCVVLQPEGSV